jgi:hypothetical protein
VAGGSVRWWCGSALTAMTAEVLGLPVRVMVVGSGGGRFLRVGRLTSEFAERVSEVAVGDQPGARVTVTLPEDITDEQLLQVQDRFAGLERYGISVTVGRGTC